MLDNNKIKLPSFGDFGKPLTKLVDAVSTAVGNLYDPEAMLARAKSKAEAQVVKAQAQIKVSSLKDRAKNRRRLVERRRQNNVETVALGAIPFLPENVSDQPPSEDWIFQFFDHVQDVGDEEMQTIWSKLLAGEVSLPGRYSLLTMSRLRTMTRTEAELFTTLATCVWTLNEDDTHLLTDVYRLRGNEPYAYADVDAIYRLDAHGLVKFEPQYGIPVETLTNLEYYGRRHYINYQVFAVDRHDHFFTHATLTEAGKQLLGIAGGTPDFEYMDRFLDGLENIFPVTIARNEPQA